jgi:hypothetical protein
MAPGIISEPADVQADDPPTAPTKQRDDLKPGRRNPVRLAAAKVMSALRGDKYMVDAYPAAGREDAAALNGHLPAPDGLGVRPPDAGPTLRP